MRPALYGRKRETIDRAQQQLAQHVERLLFERAVERAIDVLFVDDLPRAHAALQQSRRDVERHHFVGRLQERERHDLAHGITDERLGGRRDRFEMGDVESADDADPEFAQGHGILPAFGVRCFAEIIVGELVEHDDVGLGAYGGVEIEILEDSVADLDLARRNARQTGSDALEIGASFGFDPTDENALPVGLRGGGRPRRDGAFFPHRAHRRRIRRGARGHRVRAAVPPPVRCDPSAQPFALGQGAPADGPENARRWRSSATAYS